MKNENGTYAGIIEKGVGGLYTVSTEIGAVMCKARGAFRKKDGVSPMPGDHVEVSVISDAEGVITAVSERINSFVRPPVCNVRTMIIVLAACNPEPDFLLLDKLLVMAEIKNITPVICMNKTDLDEVGTFERIKQNYIPAGYRCIEVNTRDDAENSRKMLMDCFRGSGVTVFAGQSGVGKSSIVNMICEAAKMETGELSAKIQRGKNTTRHVELIPIDNAGITEYIIDTPGFTNFVNEGIYKYELRNYYPEFKSADSQCRYGDCRHICEPECRVRELVEDGSISKERYERYIELEKSLKTDKWE